MPLGRVNIPRPPQRSIDLRKGREGSESRFEFQVQDNAGAWTWHAQYREFLNASIEVVCRTCTRLEALYIIGQCCFGDYAKQAHCCA